MRRPGVRILFEGAMMKKLSRRLLGSLCACVAGVFLLTTSVVADDLKDIQKRGVLRHLAACRTNPAEMR